MSSQSSPDCEILPAHSTEDSKIVTLEQQIAAQKEQNGDIQRLSDGLEDVYDNAKLLVHIKSLTRELAEAFIDTVYVYEENKIETVFLLDDVLKTMKERIESNDGVLRG